MAFEKEPQPEVEAARQKEGGHGESYLAALEGRDAKTATGDGPVLHRSLRGRHMQMIAVGGAIGSGLFVGSASAFETGGPASVLLGFLIIGCNIYLMMQALAELAVMYPINGAFTMYIVRFVDPSWGFACGWQYAIQWLTVFPFEISAACNIIHFWQGSEHINDAAWIVPLLVILTAIQYFGVKGYGETEFVLSILKIIACTGFIILGIIINCGGVPTDHRGYLGAKYWHSPYQAFVGGFQGFCSVFVTASFAYNGTELTGLAAAESENPRKEIPRAVKQVVMRIGFFYIVNLFIVGLIVPANSPLYASEGSESRHSPFVIAIQLAGIKALPSIFNAVILLAVISVANSCAFGSTRTMQALCANGMGPKFFAFVDKKGRPTPVVILSLLFGCLAFINLDTNGGGNIFNWLLALAGLSTLFVFGSTAIAHIRFRMAWKYQGHSLDELPYRASFGIYGSYVCAVVNFICLAAQFYVALFPAGGTYLVAETFFQDYLAAFVLIFLYLIWKSYSWFKYPHQRRLWIAIKDIDVYAGMRPEQAEFVSGRDVSDEQRRRSIAELQDAQKKDGAKGWVTSIVRTLF